MEELIDVAMVGILCFLLGYGLRSWVAYVDSQRR